jgi:hypothetical protein
MPTTSPAYFKAASLSKSPTPRRHDPAACRGCRDRGVRLRVLLALFSVPSRPPIALRPREHGRFARAEDAVSAVRRP